MRDVGRLKKAVGLYTDLLVQSPDDPEIHWNLGLTQLLADDYLSGFESYGWAGTCAHPEHDGEIGLEETQRPRATCPDDPQAFNNARLRRHAAAS